jgi:hypothetical protein
VDGARFIPRIRIVMIDRTRAPRRKFSAQEDEQLRHLVSIYGENNWPAVSGQMNDRGPRQCKERWTHYLSPALIHKSWTHEEDTLLLQTVQESGSRWKVLEASFPGRSDVNLKNRYNLLIRKHSKAAIPPPPPPPAPPRRIEELPSEEIFRGPDGKHSDVNSESEFTFEPPPSRKDG